jgi:hypothetical protein
VLSIPSLGPSSSSCCATSDSVAAGKTWFSCCCPLQAPEYWSTVCQDEVFHHHGVHQGDVLSCHSSYKIHSRCRYNELVPQPCLRQIIFPTSNITNDVLKTHTHNSSPNVASAMLSSHSLQSISNYFYYQFSMSAVPKRICQLKMYQHTYFDSI